MDRKAYIDKLTAQLKLWDAEIKLMEAEAEKAKAEARIKYNKYLEDLRKQEKAAQEKLEEIRQTNEEAWKELATGAEEAFKTMQNSFMAAMSKFK